MKKNNILELLEHINNSSQKHIFIPDIVGYLHEMLLCFEGNELTHKSQLKKLALGLDRLVTDDYVLYRSEIGGRVEKLIVQILTADKSS